MFEDFARYVQVNYDEKIAAIRSKHSIEFENARFNQFSKELGISHNFLSPRTQQKNGVVERKNRTLVDIGRTMLIDAGVITLGQKKSTHHDM